MNVKVKELKGKVAKSQRRTMLIAGICGDDLLIAKAINANQKDVFSAIDKYTEESKHLSDNEEALGDIANNAIVALNDISKGKDSTERVKIFIETLTSLTFESKDELTMDDYCHAVCKLRLLETLILPEDKIIKTQYSRKSSSGKVKNFVAGDQGNFLEKEIEKANKWAATDSMTEEDKQKMDCDEKGCAEVIIKKISDDNYLNKKYSCRLQQFADWAAEQIYGLKPEFVESIVAIKDDQCLVKDLFEQYITWIKANDPNGYIDYLKDSTKEEEKNPVVEVKETKSEEEPVVEAKETKSEEESKASKDTEKPVYDRRAGIIVPKLPRFSSIPAFASINKVIGVCNNV